MQIQINFNIFDIGRIDGFFDLKLTQVTSKFY